MHNLEGKIEPQELCIVGNFVEVFLAREGHDQPVGINYLEKIQIPHLPSIYGALLAGVSVVIMGAGIPLAIPGILDAMAQHQSVEYPINVTDPDSKNEIYNLSFNPENFFEGAIAPNPLKRPDFLPIVSSEALASILLRRASGSIEGFIVEGNVAGGHNAPPRGVMTLSTKDEPVYGPRDKANLSAFRKFGRPFWPAGNYGSPEGLRCALEEGAAGVQAGTAFALCRESGLLPDVRHELVREALDGKARIYTDPQASPTGFPFKVADLPGSLSEKTVYQERSRICDIGFLRQPYRRSDGNIGYRCPAEPVDAYVAKGGRKEDTVGRKCLCNALAANIGMPQRLPDGTYEKCLVTMGDDLVDIGRFCTAEELNYSAADVIRTMLGG
jgi:nitronate monooxygenase